MSLDKGHIHWVSGHCYFYSWCKQGASRSSIPLPVWFSITFHKLSLVRPRHVSFWPNSEFCLTWLPDRDRESVHDKAKYDRVGLTVNPRFIRKLEFEPARLRSEIGARTPAQWQAGHGSWMEYFFFTCTPSLNRKAWVLLHSFFLYRVHAWIKRWNFG